MFLYNSKQKKYKLAEKRKGLSLIELLLVIGILSILVTATLVVINPGEKIAASRDDTRERDLNAILAATKQKIFVDKGWTNCDPIPTERFANIGTGINNYNLFMCLEGYLTKKAYDPLEGSLEDTKYMIRDNQTTGTIELLSMNSETRPVLLNYAENILTGGLMDYTIWKEEQTGSVGDFLAYSTGNSRINGTDPWGNEIVLWKSGEMTTHAVDYQSAGGIYYREQPIDNTKMYRMSWWEKRVTNADATYGRYYAGLNGYGNISENDGVLRRDTGANNTNPYFWWTSDIPTVDQLPVGEWVLVVGHVWPAGSGTGANHSDSGRYTVEGKIGDITLDYIWREETVEGRSRTLAIYRGDSPDIVHYTAYPRIDIIDGTEPSIEDLLNGFDMHFWF